jgi:hypothetical protein
MDSKRHIKGQAVILVTEGTTMWYPSVALLCEKKKLCRSTVFKALAGDGKLPTIPPSYVDYACEHYDVEDILW